MKRFGVDLGGTKIEAIAMAEGGAILSRQRIATPRDDYAATVAAITSLVTGLAANDRGPVGIASPGALSPATGLMKNANSTWLNDKPLDSDLAAALDRPIRLANDADCFVLSEASDGAAAGAGVVFGVILGTGVGGGIVIDGRLLAGANAIAGEWGHNPLPWPRPEWGEIPGPTCWCDRAGCIETYLSGPGLAADHPDRTKSSREIVAASEAGDPVARQTMARYEDRLARALAHMINILDPHVVVLGGGLSAIDSLYDAVPRLWSRWIFSDTIATRLLRNTHGDSGGVRGAAWLWPEPEAAV
ncbi:MAG: ROK family protein [Alphaproteobacteria bacterium]|nr:ROK family protein [Alphaproteobacteria bacterium]